jgi:hypothetical protein
MDHKYSPRRARNLELPIPDGLAYLRPGDGLVCALLAEDASETPYCEGLAITYIRTAVEMQL